MTEISGRRGSILSDDDPRLPLARLSAAEDNQVREDLGLCTQS